MLTVAVAYAITYGASQNWFFMAMPLDFLAGIVLLHTVKECAKYKYIVTETRKVVDDIQAASSKWMNRCND